MQIDQSIPLGGQQLRVHTEWQRPLSGVYFTMMEKKPRLVRMGSARPPTFTTFIITYKVAVYALAEWADKDTLTLFSSLPCTLWSTE